MTDTTTDQVRQPTLDEHQVPVDQILPNPENIRSHVGDTTELRDNIERHGIRIPLIGYWDPSTDCYRLIAGERRWTCAKDLGLETVPFVLRSEPDALTLLEIMWSENQHRAALDPIDEAQTLRRMKLLGGYTRLEQIAAKVSKSKEWVAGRLKLIDGLPESTWAKVSTGDVPISDALAVAKLKVDDDEKAALLNMPAINRSTAINRRCEQLRRAERVAEFHQTHGDDIRSYPPRHSSDHPWGVVRVGDSDGELNIPVTMHASSCDGHVAVWWDHDRTAVSAYCTTPLAHDWGSQVDIPEVGKAEPLSAIGIEWNAYSARNAHQHLCPHHRELVFPWATVIACGDPSRHTNKRRKGYASAEDLIGQFAAAGGTPNDTGPVDRWTVPADVAERIRTAAADALESLPAWLCEALTLNWGPASIGEDEDARGLLVRTAAGELVDELDHIARDPKAFDDFERPVLGSLAWGLQQCVDAGAAPPNLTEIRTRIDVITKGDLPAEEVSDG